ncbi:MAG TPA: hypothetical protein DCM32_09660 [Xanthomonadaceae bacterium]|jgi:Ni/Co efflux regulator RcnB|nr:hypothetical protein [Xanthomonadaceae bacterium]
MKTSAFPRFAALLALAFALAAPAPLLADDDDDDDDRKHHRWDGHRGGDWRDDRRWSHHDDRRWSDHDDRRWDDRRWDDRDYRQGFRDGRRHERRWDRHDDRRWHGRERVIVREVYRAPAYGWGPGWGPPPRHLGPPRWARGHRLHDYRGVTTYIVIDYHRYGLYHPPRGHHWRRDDRGDWLLVAIATGIIADVVFD